MAHPLSKITQIEVVVFEHEIRDMGTDYNGFNLVYEKGSVHKTQPSILRIHTDTGIIGETTGGRQLPANIVRYLLGKNPFEREQIYNDLKRGLRHTDRTAIGSIDVALWDLKGKIQGQPVYSLLGGKQRERLHAYASSLRFRGLEATLDTARQYLERGFRAMKIKIGQNPYDPSDDLKLVRAIRQEVGDDITLMVDVNCGYHADVKTALRVGRRLEEFNIAWYEEPLSPENFAGYHTLATTLDIPIAAGEASFTRYDFKELFTRQAVDIIQPNACRTGGLSEVQKIAALSSAFHIPYAPHTGSCSAVALAVGLHIATALPHFLTYEYMQSDWSKEQPNPLRHHLLQEPVEVFADGYLATPPEKPGLGIELNDDILQRYTVR